MSGNSIRGSSRSRRWLRRWLAAAGVIAAVLATHASADVPPAQTRIQRIEIRIVDPPPGAEADSFRYQAQQFVGIRPGDRLTAETVDGAIDRLKQSRQFRAIDIQTRDLEDGTALTFRLSPARRIKEIKFTHNFPLFEQQIRRVVTLRSGDMYVEDEISAQQHRLEELYRREGYISPEVIADADEDPEDGQMVVTFRVNKGDYFRIGDIRITGNRFISTLTLKRKMNTWLKSFLPLSAKRFVPAVLKSDMETLRQYYRKKGFAAAAVDREISLDEKKRRADIHVTVTEGPLYRVEFHGNRSLTDRRLNKDFPLLEKGNVHKNGLQNAIRTIKERYRSAGFLKTDVEVETIDRMSDGQPIRTLSFTIDEGPRTLVESVQLDGNQALKTKQIKEHMLTQPSGFFEEGAWDPDLLDEDLQAIRSLYAINGYRNPRITAEPSDVAGNERLRVVVDIEEGSQTRVTDIDLEGLSVLSDEEALSALQMKPGTPYREHMRISDGNLLSALVSEKGYPHVKVSSEVDFNSNETEGRITYRVEQGPYVTMGDVFFTGNFHTEEEILLREFRLKKGEPFSLRRMLEAQKRIRELKIVESVDFTLIGLKEKRDTVHLMCEIQERAPYYLQTSLGYETSKGLYYAAEAGNINFLGANKKVWLSASKSEIGNRAELGFAEPRLFGTPLSMDAALYNERISEFNQDFETDSTGGTFLFSQKLTSSLHSGLGFRAERRQQFLTDEAEGLETIDYEPRTLLAATPQVRIDTRDSFVRPTKGLLSILSVEFSKGLENDLDDFYKYQLDFRVYRGMTDWLTIAFMAKFGYIVPYNDSRQVADDQLFFLGGIGDVRGFDENLLRYDADGEPLGGKNAVSGTMEARIDLGHNLELALFFDSGKIGGTKDSADSDTFRSAIGAGLRYLTPIGPIGLLYGHKLDPNPGESSGQFHFAIGYTF